MSFRDRPSIPKSSVITSIIGKKSVGRPRATHETVTRKTITILPSLWLQFQKVAQEEQTNASELISKLIRQHIEK